MMERLKLRIEAGKMGYRKWARKRPSVLVESKVM
jgi:hypothetical protein